jgi:hypothetical protein
MHTFLGIARNLTRKTLALESRTCAFYSLASLAMAIVQNTTQDTWLRTLGFGHPALFKPQLAAGDNMRLQIWIIFATMDEMSPDCDCRNAPEASGRMTALVEVISRRCIATTQSSERKKRRGRSGERRRYFSSHWRSPKHNSSRSWITFDPPLMEQSPFQCP